MFDTLELYILIIKKYGSLADFASAVHCTASFVKAYIDGDTVLDTATMDIWIDALDIPDSEIENLFYVKRESKKADPGTPVFDQISIYDTNEVMRIIGRQPSCDYLDSDFDAVMNAHMAAGDADNGTLNVAIDFYLLGIICGKRLERAEKNRRAYEPLAQTIRKGVR